MIRGTAGLGDTPPGFGGDQIYRFRGAPAAEELRQHLIDVALALGLPAPADGLRIHRVGGGAIVPRALPPPPQGPPDPRPPGQGVQAAGAAAPAPRADLVWVAAEDAEDLTKGTEIDITADTVAVGDRAIMPWKGGFVSLRQLTRPEIYRFTYDDLRVLPVQFDSSGARRVALREGVQRQDDTLPAGGLDLQGPRTAAWFCRYIAENGPTPQAVHEAWLRKAKLHDGDRASHEHFVLAQVLSAAVCHDQLNVPALNSMEMVVRRLQLVKSAYSQSASAPDFSGADHFMGWGPVTASASVAPKLAAHVATKFRDEAAILKILIGMWMLVASVTSFHFLLSRPTCTSLYKDREALKALCGSEFSYAGGDSSRSVELYDRGQVSMPAAGASPPLLTNVIDPSGRGVVDGFTTAMLRSPVEMGAIMDQQAFIKPYMDLRLKRDRSLHYQFVRDLFESNLVDFGKEAFETVNPFFVRKKSGKQRLARDCRVANVRWRGPPKIRMASGSAFGSLQIPPGLQEQGMWGAGSDIADCFFWLAMPPDMRPHFALPPVPGALLLEWGVPARLGGDLHGLLEFRRMYDFASRMGSAPGRLCGEAAREARPVSYLIQVTMSDLRLEWSERVIATDACLSGYAVAATRWPQGVIKSYGAVREKWRYRSTLPSATAPRDAALPAFADPFTDINTLKTMIEPKTISPYEPSPDFAEINPKYLEKGDWKLQYASRRARAVSRASVAGASGPKALAGQDTLLESSSVSVKTYKDNGQRRTAFQEWVATKQLADKLEKEPDLVLTDYVNLLWKNGHDVSEGAKLLAAFMHALKGWARLEPGRTRPPVPLHLLALLWLEVINMGNPLMALALVTMWVAYLRPGEAMGLKESLVLDSIDLPWLGDLLAGLRRGQSDRLLFGFKRALLGPALAKAAKAVRLEKLKITPHHMRHSGPSHDILFKRRSLPTVKARGRWLSGRTVRRYEAHGRLLQQQAQVSDDANKKGALALDRLQVFSGCGRLTQALASSGIPAEAWDIEQGEAADFLKHGALE
ncbi:unnamed protein product, partial [Prorocentrum cordatum]